MANGCDWIKYQEEAAIFFRSLGMSAAIDAKIEGVRTSRDVDVLVNSEHVGFSIKWIVECKKWSSRVSKLHVLALREIVADTGADRGIILAESGFQSGALEAAALTNVKLTNLANLKKSAADQIYAMRVKDLYDRIEDCKRRYWEIDKSVRIKFELRPEVGTFGFSGTTVLALADKLVGLAFRGNYPIFVDEWDRMFVNEVPGEFAEAGELVEILEILLDELESKLKLAEAYIVDK